MLSANFKSAPAALYRWKQILFQKLDTWASLSRSRVSSLSFLLDFCPKTFVLILIYHIKMANKYKKMYTYINIWVQLNHTRAVPTCPESRYLPECHLSTGLECVCGTLVVQLHHAAIAELKAVGPVTHLPAGALCHLFECAFQHRRRPVAYSGLWGFHDNHTWVRNTNT